MNKDTSPEKREFTGFRDFRAKPANGEAKPAPARLERLGRYEILAELGRGAMGMVYKAHDPRINRTVAIKIITILNVNPSDADDYRQRFFREAQAAGRLSHSGIVTIYDVDQDPVSSTPYIVMEFVPGKRLDTFVASQPSERLPIQTSLLLVQQIAEALHYAHAQGIVHRDIKPANIIVTEEGSTKIADFGIAKFALTEFTVPGQVLGTPAFMAPEQFIGGAVDGRSDLFSLGVILYWLLTGVRPFTGESATSVSFKLVYQDPVPATTVAPSLPSQFDVVLRRALAKAPADRYQTGQEFAQDLERLRQGETVEASEKVDILDRTQVAVRGFGQEAPPTPMPAVHAKPSSARGSRFLESAFAEMWPKNKKRLNEVGLIASAALVITVAGLGVHRMIHRRPVVSQPQVERSSAAVKPVAAPSETTPAAPPAAAASAQATPEAVPPSHAKPKPVRVSQAQVQPARANPKPHVAGAIIPKTQLVLATGTAVPLSPKPESNGKATLLTVGEHSFHSATITISVDGELAYQGLLTGNRKLPFSGVRGKVSEAIRLAPGSHSIEVHVVSEHDHFDQTRKIEGEFRDKEQRTLSFEFADHNSDLQLTWK